VTEEINLNKVRNLADLMHLQHLQDAGYSHQSASLSALLAVLTSCIMQ